MKMYLIESLTALFVFLVLAIIAEVALYLIFAFRTSDLYWVCNASFFTKYIFSLFSICILSNAFYLYKKVKIIIIYNNNIKEQES